MILFNKNFFVSILLIINQFQTNFTYSSSSFIDKLSLLHEDITDDIFDFESDNQIEDNEIDDSLKNSQFKNEVIIDGFQRLHLFWNFDTVLEQLTFKLHAKIKQDQFLAFGFSDYGEFSQADFAVLWTDNNGKLHFQDTHTDNQSILHVDKSQDYELLDFKTHGNKKVIFTFKRDFDTCDNDDYIIDSGTTHIVYAIAKGHPMYIDGLNITDLKPSMTRVQLIKSQLPDPIFPNDATTLLVAHENVNIPASETTYWCRTFKLPKMKEKHHIIQFEGHISKSSQGIVHHMEVFHCDSPNHQSIPNYNNHCVKEGRPKGLESCRHVIGAWAMGAKAVTYPAEAGSAIGGKGFNHYVLLEVHYNNPSKIKGIVDNSGIKFTVTKQLREYDAGIMELGLEYTDKYALPPRQEEWNLNGYCLQQCTGTALPERGIKIFASQLHTHLTGRRAFTKHYRNGVELPELNRDNHYSPHFQEVRKLFRQVNVLPGDVLITTCQDQTIHRKEITLGGFAISDEMCVNYVHYYPKIDLEVCKSSVTTENLYKFFDFMNKYAWQNTSSNKGISDNYKSIKWSPINVDFLSDFYSHAGLSMQCNKSDGGRFEGIWENLPIPNIKYPLPPSERPCLTK